MTLSEHIKNLQKLESDGHGEKQVFTCVSASGTVYEVNSCRVTDYIGECGPYDLEPDEKYVSISIG